MVNNPTVQLIAELGSGPREVGRARRALARVLHQWGVIGDSADLAILMTSELVTNAIRHGAAPVLLKAGLADRSLRVEVQDLLCDGVELHDPAPDDEDGRGLQIVDVLSDLWGWGPHERGKQVWFVVATAAGTGAASRPG